jgi:hypothetical protein
MRLKVCRQNLKLYFSSAWNCTFARLHKNEVTRNYPHGGVGFEMCDGELETATLFIVGVDGKAI